MRLADRARRVTNANRARLIALALSSLAGFICVNALVLAYDSSVGYGPLAGVLGPIEPGLRSLPVVLGPLVYAVATWRLNVRGALIALAGFVFLGPLLFYVFSPLSADPSERLVCCDGVRILITATTSIYGILAFLVVVPDHARRPLVLAAPGLKC